MKKKKLTPGRTIILSFLGAIIVGAIVLMLPFCSRDNSWTSPVTALFTSVTSVCVTGLTVVDTYSYWSVFGQIIILILIQLGGLGLITIVNGFFYLLGQRVTLSNRMLLEEIFNLNGMEKISKFMKLVLVGTAVVEGAGFVACLFVFVPEYGAYGIWVSLFHAISAFCNAGLDILGPDSLQGYAANIPLNIITMLLIIIGGLGFIVWNDLAAVPGKIRKKEIRGKNIWQNLALHTKIVLKITLILIVGGAVLFAVFEWNNPETIGNMTVGDKILASLFQSVTTRTAGFASIPQGALSGPSIFLSIILMFIGGSPIGTAGGVKTITIILIVFMTQSIIKGRDCTVIGRRQVNADTVKKAVAIVCVAILIFSAASVVLSLVQDSPFGKACYHIMSALGTVGLSMESLGDYNLASKILLMVCMFFGRIGPLTLVVAITPKGKKNESYPERNVVLG